MLARRPREGVSERSSHAPQPKRARAAVPGAGALTGHALREYLDLFKKVPLAVALEWIHALLEGLALAHREHCVHRDVKPENAFLARTDEGGPQVDFGLDKDLGADHRKPGITTTSPVPIGTVRHMSPERNDPSVDAGTDVWAVVTEATGVAFEGDAIGRRPSVPTAMLAGVMSKEARSTEAYLGRASLFAVIPVVSPVREIVITRFHAA